MRLGQESGLPAAVVLAVTVLLLTAADGATLTRQSREVAGAPWAGLPKCSLGSICGFRIVGDSYDDESHFVQTCHCMWHCEKGYFNLATRVSKFRCQE